MGINSLISYFLVALLAIQIAAKKSKKNSEVWGNHARHLNGNNMEKIKKHAKQALSSFSSHTIEFFEELDSTGAENLFQYAANADSLDDYVKNKTGTGDLKKICGNFKKSDFEKMQSGVCEIFVHALELWNDANHISKVCKKNYLEKLGNRDVRITTVGGIPAKWFADDGKKIAKAIYDADHELFDGSDKSKLAIRKLSPEAFAAMMKRDDDDHHNENENCKFFPAKVLDNLSSEQAKEVSPNCFVALRKISSTNIKCVASLSPQIFSFYNGSLTEETIKKITADQLHHFATKNEGKEKCRKLDLPKVSQTAMKRVSKDCLAGWLSVNEGSEIGKVLANAPIETFKGWKGDDYNAFGKISISDYRFLSTQVIQIMIDTPEAVSSLPREESKIDIFDKGHIKGVVVTSETFSRLAKQSPAMASQIFVQAETLPDDVLISCEPKSIKKLVGENDKTSVRGLEFLALQAKKNRTNIKAIISVMGNRANEHICGQIKAEQYLKKLGALRPLFGDTCRKNLPFAKNTDILKQAPELAADTDEIWRNMLKDITPEKWRDVEPGLFAVLVEKPAFCKVLAGEHKQILKHLTNDHLEYIGSTCALILKDNITIDMVPKLAPDAFAAYTASDFSKFELKHTSTSQLSLISDKISMDSSDHVFSQLNASKLNSDVADSRVHILSAKQWGAMSATTISGFLTADRLKLVSPSSLASLSDTQLNSLNEAVILSFSPDQIAQVGKSRNAKLDAFEKVKEKISTPQLDTLNLRLSERQSGSYSDDSKDGSTWKGILIYAGIILLILIVLGVCGFFAYHFWINRQEPILNV